MRCRQHSAIHSSSAARVGSSRGTTHSVASLPSGTFGQVPPARGQAGHPAAGRHGHGALHTQDQRFDARTQGRSPVRWGALAARAGICAGARQGGPCRVPTANIVVCLRFMDRSPPGGKKCSASPSWGVDVAATSALSRPERVLARVEEAAMALGVHSEVGKLRKVMVHRPGLDIRGSHHRTPRSCSSTTCCG